MANRAVVVPTFDQLMNPTLVALHGLGRSASIPELVERVTVCPAVVRAESRAVPKQREGES